MEVMSRLISSYKPPEADKYSSPSLGLMIYTGRTGTDGLLWRHLKTICHKPSPSG